MGLADHASTDHTSHPCSHYLSSSCRFIHIYLHFHSLNIYYVYAILLEYMYVLTHVRIYSQLGSTSQSTGSSGSATGALPRMLSFTDLNSPHHQQVMRQLQSLADENLM